MGHHASWLDRAIDVFKPQPGSPPKPRAPRVDQNAWNQSVDQKCVKILFLHKGDLGGFDAGVLPLAFSLRLKWTNLKIGEDIRRQVFSVSAHTFPAASVSVVDPLQVRGEFGICAVSGALP